MTSTLPLRSVAAVPRPTLFIIDFDGTVAPADTVDGLLARFADPAWEEIEQQWVRGEITSRECMAAQVALVAGDDDALLAFLRAVEIDPSFAEFIDFVRPLADVAVVSDGLDYPIRHALRAFDLPIYANRLQFRRRGLALDFPFTNPKCEVGSGVCKCAVARQVAGGRDTRIVLIGDGRSDLCVASHADLIFAKSTLRRYCEREGLAHVPFETFNDILTDVRGCLIPDAEEITCLQPAPM